MTRLFKVLVLLCLIAPSAFGQVKPAYLYNTNMPYGTLDIRTRINSTDFYYLVEGKTFSFREAAPGVRSETFLKMTNFDTSPYHEGHMRHKKGSDDYFEMNYRFLLPRGHKSTYKPGYPMIVLMHGAVERANCYYEECYHGGWEYDPNLNIPPAPSNPDHKLLNNDHHLAIGAREHLAARNRAGDRLPDDPSLPDRAFPGFVLMPQMFNDWDSLWVEKVIRMVQLHVEKYNIDPDRIYIHGLSIGGYAVYESLKRAPWLFTAALPMSAVTEAAKIFEHNQQDKVSHIPLWIFQGARDTEPTAAWTSNVLNKFRAAGASVRYSQYSDLGHNVWGRAYAEPDFFSWMLSRRKTDLFALSGNKEINKSENKFPVLILAEGFFAYQWERDGKIIAGATSNRYTATEPGSYRARFSRVASPSSSDWTEWSRPVIITITSVEEEPDEELPGDEEPEEEEPEEEQPDEEPGGDTPGNEPPPGNGEETPPSDNDNDPDPETPPNDSPPGEEDPSDGDDDAESEDPDEDGHFGNDGEHDPVTGIADAEPLRLSVYPNPTSGHRLIIHLEGNNGKPFQYFVRDALGRDMITGDHGGQNTQLELRPSAPLPPGVYLLLIRQEQTEYKQRIMVRHE